MVFLDMVFRFGAISLLFVLSLLSWRGIKPLQARLILVGLLFTTIAMLLSHIPDYVETPRAVFVFGRVFDVPNLIFIWLFGFQIFDDSFKVRAIHILTAMLYILPVCMTRSYDLGLTPAIPHWFVVIIDLYAIGLILYLFFVILRDRADDLVNERRRVRVYFVASLLIVTLFATTADMVSPGYHLTVANWIKTLSVFPLVIWAYLWLTSLHSEKILFQPRKARINSAPKLDPRDNSLKAELLTLMENERVYKEPGLTIRTLSEKLRAPEHRLRSLINNGLGYRNFSTFLNQYRIDAIKLAFAEPKNARIPVLTIALNHGYNSLAPFNRAFKNAEGKTPTEYRQTIFANAD